MKSYIPSLNGLRAISIIMVIFNHFSIHNFFPKDGIVNSISVFCFNGPLGVNIFFAISGFLITTLLMREEQQEGDISLKGFYQRRIVRIFPAYYFLLIVYYILTLFGYFNLSKIDWISSLTYTKQFFNKYTSFETAHLWSLSVEEVFYLIWPLIFICLRKYRTSICIVFLTIGCFMRYLVFEYPAPGMVNIIFTSGDALIIGCLFAIKYKHIVSWMSDKKRLVMLIFPLLVFSIMVHKYLYHLQSSGAYHSRYDLNDQWLPLSYGFFGQIGTITNLFIGMIIIYSINIKSLWFKFLNLPVMNYIGQISYSLYLWQELFTADRPYLHKIPVVIVLLMIFGSACFSYYLIEKPFLKFKHGFGHDRSGLFSHKAVMKV